MRLRAVLLAVLTLPSWPTVAAPVPPPRIAGTYDGTWDGHSMILTLRRDGTSMLVGQGMEWLGRWKYNARIKEIVCVERSPEWPHLGHHTTVYRLDTMKGYIPGGQWGVPVTLRKRQ